MSEDKKAPPSTVATRIAAIVTGTAAGNDGAPPPNDLPTIDSPPLAAETTEGDAGQPQGADAPATASPASAPRKRRGRPRRRRDDNAEGEAGGEEHAAPRKAPRRRSTAADTIGEIAEGAEFWRAPSGDGHATIDVNGHRENWPLESRGFERWLASRIFDVTGVAPTSNALKDIARLCDVLAQRGPTHQTYRRVARVGDRVFIDLCDDAWRAVEVTAQEWRVIDSCPAKFLRSSGMLPLPEPEASDSGLSDLRGLVNADGEDNFTLVVSWLVGALSGEGPFPIAVLSGEAGTGKSRLAVRMRSLVDPFVAAMRSPPKDLRDLFAGAANEFVVVLDNISSMQADLSDELCRIASGSASAARALHTNTEQVFLTGARPIILNGIGGHFGAQADLMSRALAIRLAPIPETARRTDREMDAEFAAAQPRIIAALLDAVSAALRNAPTTTLAKLPRMADFALWMIAAEPGLGWEPGTFVQALESGREETMEAAYDADIVAKAIVAWIADEHPTSGWEGTPSQLHEILTRRTPEEVRRSRSWPATAMGLGTRVDRVADLLRWKGLTFVRRRGERRTLIIAPSYPQR